jgi:uncharacterized protein YegP (UPF0339 family)
VDCVCQRAFLRLDSGEGAPLRTRSTPEKRNRRKPAGPRRFLKIWPRNEFVERGTQALSNRVFSKKLGAVKLDVRHRTKENPPMATRPYPSYWMYKDNRGEWRWKYDASNYETIAVSSEGYKNRRDCDRSITIMKGSSDSPIWMPNDLLNAA